MAALYFGRELRVPSALAMLLAFVLAPVSDRICRLGLSRGVAVAAVVLLTTAALGGLSLFVAGQVRLLGKELPTYQSNIADKFDGLRTQLRTPGLFSQASHVLDVVEQEIAQTQEPLDRNPANSATRRPARVEVVPVPLGAYQRAVGWVERVGPPVALLVAPLARCQSRAGAVGLGRRRDGGLAAGRLGCGRRCQLHQRLGGPGNAAAAPPRLTGLVAGAR